MPLIRVGTCGFCMRQEEYFRTFPVIEIQQTFYRPPLESTVLRWREMAPEGFEFAIKAFQAITHPPESPTYRRSTLSAAERARAGGFRDTAVVRRAWQTTLRLARKLGARFVVFQCPASFTPQRTNLANLRRFFRGIDRDELLLGWEPRDAARTPRARQGGPGASAGSRRGLRAAGSPARRTPATGAAHRRSAVPRAGPGAAAVGAGSSAAHVDQADATWSDDLVRELCRELGLIHVVDPFVRPAVWGQPCYWRLHGVTGYRHRFSDQELEELYRWCLAEAPVAAGSAPTRVYCLFNNVSMREDALRFMRRVGRPAAAR